MSDLTYPHHEHDIKYGTEHALQNLDICLARPLAESSPKSTVWIIFIHGGAWRDPAQNKSELQPALDQFFASDASPASRATLQRIAGFASVNYGLSTHAPSDDESVDASLRVQHPTHIIDVMHALEFLRERYAVGAKEGYDYVLVGHSAGAFLALQTLLPIPGFASPSPSLKPATAIVGLAGIYGLPLLVRNHAEQPFYREFVTKAFGEDEDVWREVSVINGEYGGIEELRIVLLGASEGDVLVEKAQVEGMEKALEGLEGVKVGRLSLEGTHDEIWRLGKGVRGSIEEVVKVLESDGEYRWNKA